MSITLEPLKGYDEDDLVMISALQHYLFCPHQCDLIHIEQQWLENRFTVEGHIFHERVHGGGRESRRTLRVEFDVPIRSLRLGLISGPTSSSSIAKKEACGSITGGIQARTPQGR